MSVVKLMCEIYHMCMFSNNYIVVMCVNNANVCILDGVSTIVSTSVWDHTVLSATRHK